MRTTLVGALATPRLREPAEAYKGRTSIRKEVEELIFNLARVEREIPELAHDLELQQRKSLPTLEDCL